MTLASEALRAGVGRLRAAGVADPARDARLLIAAALGVAPARVALALREPLSAATENAFSRMLAARAARQPVAQILGRREFWGRDFAVSRAVLDPRPETETLIARALEGAPARRLLDLGTGTGILAVTLLAEWPAAQATATDLSPVALAVARRNAERHGVAARLELLISDWGAAVEGCFDLVVSNPPYIAAAELAALAPEVRDWEPPEALSPGPTGLEAYRRIAAELPRLLAPGGRALFEIGAAQGAEVAAILAAAGFPDARIWPDLDGRDRLLDVAG